MFPAPVNQTFENPIIGFAYADDWQFIFLFANGTKSDYYSTTAIKDFKEYRID